MKKAILVALLAVLLGSAFHAQATEVSKYSVSCQQELKTINDKINSSNSADDMFEALSVANEIFDAYGNRGLSVLRNAALDPQMSPTEKIQLENRIFKCRENIADRLTQIRSLLAVLP
jgi:SAM-dependent MidA family methyltransferase